MNKKQTKVDTKILDRAAKYLMSTNDKPITKEPHKRYRKLYKQQDNSTVLVRTNNDRRLLVTAESTDRRAKLDFDDTDWILIVIPEEKNAQGNIVAYLVPTAEAAYEIYRIHDAWLDNHPNTAGDNTTWKLCFDYDDGDQKIGENNFAEKWKNFRLPGNVSSFDYPPKKS